MSTDERDRKIAEDYKTATVPEIAKKYGLTIPHIHKILKDLGVEKVGKKKQKRTVDERVISPTHRKLGSRFYFHRVGRLHDLDVTSERMNLSGKKIRTIELGVTDVTLSELMTMAEYMGVKLTDLLKDL